MTTPTTRRPAPPAHTITIGNRRHGAQGHYVGRPSPLGNPFIIRAGQTRERVIAMYADWLGICLREPETPQAQEFAQLVELARQGDLTLVCHCAPADCHARIIKERIERELEASHE